jgi:hypothetical protein
MSTIQKLFNTGSTPCPLVITTTCGSETGASSTGIKIEPISSTLNYNILNNTLTHIFNEETIFLNTLDSNTVIKFDLMIDTPQNYKTYVQSVIIDCLKFKGFINTLKINGVVTEINHKVGDTNINLAPISGYSTIIQTFKLTRMNDQWYAMSCIELFYDSNRNSVDDTIPPVITVRGDSIVNHEINSGTYVDVGATALDNIDGDITNNIIVSGDIVDVSTLGTYTILYNVVDSSLNSAIQKSRVVNVIDITNPVITLNGDAEVSVILNETYTELGATATDNSLEIITVTISGDIVDSTTLGDYTVIYTAIDSSGNVHQIGRLVHVQDDGYTLQFSNPTTDLLGTHVDFNSHMNVSRTVDESDYTFTISGNPSTYLNGNYSVQYCGRFDKNTGANTFFVGTNQYIALGWSYNFTLNSSIYGTIQGPFGDPPYGVDLLYQPQTDSNGTVVDYTVTDVDSNSYGGEYVEISFPFFVEVSKLTAVFYSTSHANDIALLGKNGNDYHYVGGWTGVANGNSEYSTTISTTSKYKTFRAVFVKVSTTHNGMTQIKLFGDIYT